MKLNISYYLASHKKTQGMLQNESVYKMCHLRLCHINFQKFNLISKGTKLCYHIIKDIR